MPESVKLSKETPQVLNIKYVNEKKLCLAASNGKKKELNRDLLSHIAWNPEIGSCPDSFSSSTIQDPCLPCCLQGLSDMCAYKDGRKLSR
jgi:hypothetical protein